MAKSKRSLEEQLKDASAKTLQLKLEILRQRTAEVESIVDEVLLGGWEREWRRQRFPNEPDEQSENFPGAKQLELELIQKFEELESLTKKYQDAQRAHEDAMDAEEEALRQEDETTGRLLAGDAKA